MQAYTEGEIAEAWDYRVEKTSSQRQEKLFLKHDLYKDCELLHAVCSGIAVYICKQFKIQTVKNCKPFKCGVCYKRSVF